MRVSRSDHFLRLLILALPLAATAQWVPTNGPTGSGVGHLATDGTSLFAATSEYGIVQTRDRGASWKLLEPPGYFLVRDMVARGDTLYVADGYSGVQIHPGKGSPWRRMNTGLGDTLVNTLAFGWGGLLAVTESGHLYQFPDQGARWIRLDSGAESWAAMDYTNPPLALDGDCAYMAGSAGVRRSLNRGRTWGKSVPDSQVTAVSTVVAQPPFVFALSSLGVYRSRDSGATWTKVAMGAWADSAAPKALVAVGAHLYAGNYQGGMLSSSDAGETWGRDTGPVNAQIADLGGGMAALGPDVFAGNSSGAFRSSDFGLTWSAVNNGIGVKGTTQLVAAGSGRLAACRGPAGYVSEDHGGQWRSLALLAFRRNAFDDMTGADGVLYALALDAGLFRSDDGGRTWEMVLSPSDLGPSLDSKLFTVGPDVYFSGAIEPTPIMKLVSPLRAGQSPLPAIPAPPRAPLRLLALCAGVPYAIYFENLLRFDATTRLWRQLARLPASHLTALGSQGSAVLIGTQGAGILRSTDSGGTWKTVTDSAAFGAINALLEVGGSVFAATDSGLAVSRNGGPWTAMNQGFETDLPTNHGYDSSIHFNYKTSHFLAAQDGYLYTARPSGIWRIPVDSAGSGIVSRRAAGPRKPAARWMLVSGSVGFDGASGDGRWDVRGRVLGTASRAANRHP